MKQSFHVLKPPENVEKGTVGKKVYHVSNYGTVTGKSKGEIPLKRFARVDVKAEV